VVLAGLGCEFEGVAPYTPFVDAWADLSRVRTGAENPFLTFEPVPGASAQEDRLRLLRAVERSLFDLAGEGRVCVLIEDVHQADASSLQLFHHLARASRHLPLQLIGTLREEEVHLGNPLHTLLGSLARERTTRRLVLQRLDRAATRELIVDHWGAAPDPSSVDTVYRLAGGNPFFTEQLATAVREAGGEGGFTPSSDIMATVRARMSRLGPDVERLLLAASIQGVRFDFEVAHTTAGLEPEPALDALDITLSARIVEEGESKYRFRHALLREALYDSLSSARRIYLHRATATELERATPGRAKPDPELLAFHHHAAGNLEQALPYVLAATERAQSRLGFGEAVTTGQRALEIMDALGTPPGPELFSVLRNVGGMRVALGDLEAAVRDLDRAATLNRASPPWTPEPAQRCRAKRLAGLALIEAGDLEAAAEHLDDALAALGNLEDGGELSNVYYLYAQLRWHQSRHEEAFELAQRCLSMAEKADDEEGIARGYEMLALACHSLGEWKEGRKYEERRSRISDGTLDVASAFDVHL
jgi:tetratricopeptide (TPR) repeat protein